MTGCRYFAWSTRMLTSQILSFAFHEACVASVAGRAQLRNEQFEFVASFFAARVEGELRSLCGSLIKIREISPDIRRSERIRRGVPIAAGTDFLRGNIVRSLYR